MFVIVKVDGKLRAIIDTHGEPNKYGKPKEFKNRKEAEKWVERKSYGGMSYKYVIKEV